MIRLIVSDLDGTILRDAEHVDEKAAALLKKYTAQGAVFVPASGRAPSSCRALFERAGLRITRCIGVNGAQIEDFATGETHYMRSLPDETARRAIEIMQAEGLQICIYGHGLIAYTWETALEESRERSLFAAMRAFGTETIAGPDAVERALRGPILKTFAEFTGAGDREAFLRAREACRALEGVTITASWENNFEVMPEGVDKGAALMYLAGKLGVRREEIVAFGDGDNDISMLRAAGTGVAMAAGDPAAKAAADCTAASVAEWLLENEARFAE